MILDLIETEVFRNGDRDGLNISELNVQKFRYINKGRWAAIIPIFSVLSLCEILSLNNYRMRVEWMIINTSWLLRDYLRIRLISLTVFVVLISLISRDLDFNIDGKWGRFCRAVVLVGVVCTCFFCSSDFLPIFFFFERRLVPTIALILGWGHQPERLQAGLQIIIYTVCGSLPLLVLLIRV